MITVTAIIGAVMSLIVAGLSGPVQALFARKLQRMKQQRALARIKSEPYFEVLETYKLTRICLKTECGLQEVTGGPWIIDEIRRGRVVLREHHGDIVWPMTCAEFEELEIFIDRGSGLGMS